MLKWTTFSKAPATVTINAIHFPYIEVRPSSGAVKGTYLFNVVSCYDKVTGSTPSSANCKETSLNLWGGSAQQLLISVV